MTDVEIDVESLTQDIDINIETQNDVEIDLEANNEVTIDIENTSEEITIDLDNTTQDVTIDFEVATSSTSLSYKNYTGNDTVPTGVLPVANRTLNVTSDPVFIVVENQFLHPEIDYTYSSNIITFIIPISDLMRITVWK